MSASSSSSSEFSNLVESVTNSPVNVSSVESSEEETHLDVGINSEKSTSWPKYKHFRDPETGEEAIYVLLEKAPTSPPPVHHHKHAKKDETWKVCRQLLDLSSISLFVASNLLAFTVGLLIGKRSVEF